MEKNKLQIIPYTPNPFTKVYHIGYDHTFYPYSYAGIYPFKIAI